MAIFFRWYNDTSFIYQSYTFKYPVSYFLLDVLDFRFVPYVVPHILVKQYFFLTFRGFWLRKQIKSHLRVDHFVHSSLHNHERYLVVLKSWLTILKHLKKGTYRSQSMHLIPKKRIFLTVLGIIWIFAAILGLHCWDHFQGAWKE